MQLSPNLSLFQRIDFEIGDPLTEPHSSLLWARGFSLWSSFVGINSSRLKMTNFFYHKFVHSLRAWFNSSKRILQSFSRFSHTLPVSEFVDKIICLFPGEKRTWSKILKARRTPYIPGHEPKNGDPNMAGDLCADNSMSLTFASSSALLNNSKLRLGSSLMGSAFPSGFSLPKPKTSKPSSWRPAKKLAQGDTQLSPLPEPATPSDLACRRLNRDFFHLIVQQIWPISTQIARPMSIILPQLMEMHTNWAIPPQMAIYTYLGRLQDWWTPSRSRQP